MAWRCTKVEDQREYLVKSYISKLATMKDLCEECGISRKTGYKWYHRYMEGGVDALLDQDRAPKDPCKKFSETMINKALSLKEKYPKYGPKKILVLLKKKFPNDEWPSATRLYEIFKDHHLVCSRKLRRRVPRTHPLGEVNASNDVWCADFKGWFLTQDESKIEPLTITDGYSRYVIRCQHLEKKSFEEVWKVYSDAFYQYGLPKRIRTDNGPPFATTAIGRLSRLAINLIKVGIIPEWIQPGHPEENGRHERFHRTLKEGIATPPASNFSEQIQRMEVFVEEYNFERPHESLNLQTPGSCYEPSSREWNGKLCSPEYDSSKLVVRKVGSSGCIYLKQRGYYLGQILSGEYVGLDPIGFDNYKVYYGPVFLGTLLEKGNFVRPKQLRRRNQKCYPC